jgi:prepilin-type N-terminal cleavage/methylation domain-containing protein
MKMKNRIGFTLLEVLIAIAILATLVLIIVPSGGSVISTNKINEIKNNASTIEIALANYYTYKKQYPVSTLVDPTQVSLASETIIRAQLSSFGLDPNLYTSLKTHFMVIDNKQLGDYMTRNVADSFSNYFYVDRVTGIAGYNNEISGLIYTKTTLKDKNGIVYSGKYN